MRAGRTTELFRGPVSSCLQQFSAVHTPPITWGQCVYWRPVVSRMKCMQWRLTKGKCESFPFYFYLISLLSVFWHKFYSLTNVVIKVHNPLSWCPTAPKAPSYFLIQLSAQPELTGMDVWLFVAFTEPNSCESSEKSYVSVQKSWSFLTADWGVPLISKERNMMYGVRTLLPCWNRKNSEACLVLRILSEGLGPVAVYYIFINE